MGRAGWFAVVVGIACLGGAGFPAHAFARAIRPPSWVPFMRGVWSLDEPAGSVRHNATGDAAGDLIESVSGAVAPSQGPARRIPNDTTPGEFQQGTGSARWNQTPPLEPGDGHDTFLHCGATWDDSACAALFDLRGSMSIGCWTRGRDSPFHIEHRMIDHLDLATHSGYEAVWSGGHHTGFHYGCKWWPEPPGLEAVSGVPFAVPAGQWGHGVCVLDLAATGDEGKVYSNGMLANDQRWTPPASPPHVGFNISDHASDGGFDGELDECFVAAGALTAAEVCRICSCGVDGSLCACDPADPRRYAAAGTGRNGTACVARICVGGIDTHRVHETGPGEVCAAADDCPGGGRCSTNAVPCDLGPVACNQPAPAFAGTITTTTSIPPPSCRPADCDDADPCTLDRCVDGSCRHALEPGLDGARCLLGAIDAEVESAGSPEITLHARRRLAGRVSRVRALVGAAEVSIPHRRRDLRRATRRLAATLRLLPELAGRARISHDLAGLLAWRLDAVKLDVERLIGEPPGSMP